MSIDKKAKFDFVRYANCWEDADILVEALQPEPGKRILSIASAGDNSLSLLAGGADVVAVDLNPVQLACLELRCAAIAELDYDALLAFLGVHESAHRFDTYQSKLRQGLSASALNVWDERPADIEAGVIHRGKFENYFRMFRRYALPLVHTRNRVNLLLQPRDNAAARRFYAQVWDTWRWQLIFRCFFSRAVMGRAGRDSAFFDHVQGSVADRILDRTSYALTELETCSNPYLGYILTGNFNCGLPHYLREQNVAAIRSNLDNLTIVHGTTDTVFEHDPPGFDGFNLSDIFEYMDEPLFANVVNTVAANARPHARLAYWNMLVPRAAADCSQNIRHLDDLSTRLFAQDKAWFYNRFLVDEILPTATTAIDAGCGLRDMERPAVGALNPESRIPDHQQKEPPPCTLT